MALQLPRLHGSIPVVNTAGIPTIGFVNWWNTVCGAIEGAINTLSGQQTQIQAQQTAIDNALGIAQGADATATGAAQTLAKLTTIAAHSVLVGEGAQPITGVTPVNVGDVLTSTGGSTDPTFKGLTAVLDTAFGTPGEGTIIYRGASAWIALAPGLAGTKLTSGGPGAPLTWV